MKQFLLIIFIGASIPVMAQTDDLGRIALNSYVSNNLSIPSEAKAILENKLSTIATQYAMGSSSYKPRFVITANVGLFTKDVVAGPPAMIAQTMNITLYIGDGIENLAFTSINMTVKGVGTNENKAFIDGFKNIPTKNAQLEKFMQDGKQKIIDYYITKCAIIEEKASSLAAQSKYDEAIYELASIPDVCKDCYTRSRKKMAIFFKQKIDAECNQKLTRAKGEWASNQSSSGARSAGNILLSIHPAAACMPQVNEMLKNMSEKIAADERAAWELKVKQYNDQVARENQLLQYARQDADREYELSKIRAENFKQIAIEVARNLPKTITTNNYTRINWW
ncbi:MAG: hypothetical protein WCH59_10140 [Chitinophagia bacterium]|jgi:hypothetical protein